MKKLIYISILILCSSCAKFYTYMPKSDFDNDKNDTTLKIDSIKLDASYKFYLRQICRVKPPDDYYISQVPSNHAAVERCNCELIPDTLKRERLEVEYLFYSKSKHNLIYITTIPPEVLKLSDKTVALYDQSLFNKESFPNINYFYNFFFAKVKDNDTIQFKSPDNKGIHKWQFVDNGDYLEIKNLNFTNNRALIKTPVESQLSLPVRFYNKQNWNIIINNNLIKQSDSSEVCPINYTLKNNTIFLISKRKNGRPCKVVFYFEDGLIPQCEDSKNPNSTYYYLYFTGKRVKTLQDSLYE